MEVNKKAEKKQQKKQTKKAAKKVVKEINRIADPKKDVTMDLRGSLIRMSGYLRTLTDPFNCVGEKIPDMITTPSCAAQLLAKIQIAINAQGVGGLALEVGRMTQGGATGLDATTSGSTFASLGWAQSAKAYQNTLAGFSDQHRVVSAAIAVTYQGATQTDAGRILACFIPAGGTNGGAVVSNGNTLINMPYCRTFPLKRGYGQVLYFPLDPFTSFSYRSSGGGVSTLLPAFNGVLYLIIDGGTSTNMVEFTYVENVEFIPVSALGNLAAPTASTSDPLEMSVASNAIATNPNAAVEQPRKPMAYSSDSISPGSNGHVNHTTGSGVYNDGITMLERVVSGGERLMGSASKIAGLAAPLLALL